MLEPGSPVATHIQTRNTKGVGSNVERTTSVQPPSDDSGDVAEVLGHWIVSRDKARFSLVIELEAGRLTGTLTPERGPTSPENTEDGARRLEHVIWDAATGRLHFRVEEEGQWLWFSVAIAEGAMKGRYATVLAERVGPASWSAYSGHVTGWRQETFERDIVPRVFDIVVDDGRYVRLWIDRSSANASEFVGELKTKATATDWTNGELPTQPIVIRRWDGQQLAFDTTVGTSRQRFTGTVSGRTIEGAMVADRVGEPVSFTGSRGDVFGYGLRSKSAEDRTEWQERTRRALAHMIMAGNPSPLSTQVTVTESPLRIAEVLPDRDDDSGNWQQQYRLSEVVLEHTLPNPYGIEPLTRRVRGRLAVPIAPPPSEGYGIVLTLNGHLGSSVHQFQPDDSHWYGDGFARRGYMVFAIDVSHRPPGQTGGVYEDVPDGDSPEHGNNAHPAIAAAGMDSDWTEDGERAWDAMRGIDYLLTQPNVNPAKIVVTGLSMGAEVTEIVGALDPRVTTVIPASAPPDLSILVLRANHPCWQWAHGDITEYVESSDYLALTAPRRLVLETGKTDWTFSGYTQPYAVEKEKAWRGRIAYGDEVDNFVHYLHSGAHQYRVGDVSGESPDPAYIQVPELVAPPALRRRTADWELSGDTVSLGQTLFDYVAR